MKLRLLKQIKLTITLSLVSLLIYACDNTRTYHDHNESEETDSSLETLKINQDFSFLQSKIGSSFEEYPNSRPLNERLEASAYENVPKITNSYRKSLPIYEIIVDTTSLEHAKNLLLKRFSQPYTRFKVVERGSDLIVYESQDQSLEVNYTTGQLLYLQKPDINSPFYGLETVELDSYSKQANVFFQSTLAKNYFANSYFHRLYSKINSFAQRSTDNQTDLTYEVMSTLAPTINGLPILGDGGGSTVTFRTDNVLSIATLSFVKFQETTKFSKVKIISPEIAYQRLLKKLEDDHISLEDHQVLHSKFGYHYNSSQAPTRWLVPFYTFDVIPKTGVMDKGRLYEFVASDTNDALKAFQENVNLEHAYFDQFNTAGLKPQPKK